MSKLPVVIVGGGITGLTAGERLARAGVPVVILERETGFGGLARSFRYGDYTFDIGPHRFHTHNQEVDSYIQDILKEGYLSIGRNSSVYFQNKYFTWPLQTDALFKLSPGIALKCFRDLITGRNNLPDNDTFENYVIRQYGPTLYELFFKQYTEKFAFVGCDQLHKSWASASVDRAIIDRRVRMNSLPDAVKMVLLPRKSDISFRYPRRGCGTFCRIQEAIIKTNGGKCIQSVVPTRIECSDSGIKCIRTADMEIYPSKVIWTAPITEFARLMGWNESGLGFMNTILFNVILRTLSPPP